MSIGDSETREPLKRADGVLDLIRPSLGSCNEVPCCFSLVADIAAENDSDILCITEKGKCFGTVEFVTGQSSI